MKKIINIITSDGYLLFGSIGILVLLFIAFAAPALVSVPAYSFEAPGLLPPGTPGHPLGTNHLGQDILSMLIYGTRTSLKVGLVSSLISGVLGVVIGGIAGYFGGRVDGVLSEIINVFMMIPTLFLILLIVALFGNSIVHVMVVIGITSWPGNAKIMRAQALSLKQRVFVMAAKSMGETDLQILFRYIIPNGIFPIVSNTTAGMAGAILTEASLSFLGLGDPTVISWGQMILNGKSYLTTGWWIATFAGLAIVVTVLIFYATGDGLNNVLNPKKRRQNHGTDS